MTTMAFWDRVKKLIKAHKITQKQFAEYINMPSGTFEGLMYHNREPIVSLALDIATALGVTVEYLVNGNDRDIKDKRLKELADRETAVRISKLSVQIQKETEKITNKPKTRSS